MVAGRITPGASALIFIVSPSAYSSAWPEREHAELASVMQRAGAGTAGSGSDRAFRQV